MITTFLYMVFCIVYCLMHAYDVCMPMPCLVSMNSSSDDLNESVYVGIYATY